METPVKTRTAEGPPLRPAQERAAVILGSLTVPGRPDRVCAVRAFVAQTLAAADRAPRVDSDAATLLASELVTNAILHTASGAAGGTVTVVLVGIGDGLLVEVIDDGSDSLPAVREELLAVHGHGLYLVQQMAAHWGYLRDPAGTNVWFHLAAQEDGQ